METEVSVKDVLTTSYVGVSESDSVRGAVELMRAERAGSVLVVRGSSAVGIMTEWDVMGVVEAGQDPDTVTVGSVMSSPVLTIEPDRSLTDAAGVMARDAIRNLVVEDDEGIVGVLTQRDVIAAAGSFSGTTTVGNSEPMAMAADTVAQGVETNGGTDYTTQGVCDSCGTFAESLRERNGQLVCNDCRSI
ncbi:CBS domain-containing protein [Halovivax cerinus]|uniref:Cyclic nucleotide-binding/CBS domain-containing protein n=1 Tax=Halovivax cerinus TaxID=1487865 RepID=A0ABD5NMM3_9EURY|nr:CBS domain-containing protein [Halovivax cerinus]